MNNENNSGSVELAAKLTIAWLSNNNNRVATDEVPSFLRSMHATLKSLTGEPIIEDAKEGIEIENSTHIPAVSVRKSLASRDHIISLIDGKAYRTLRRHLAAHGLTPEEYRARYNLRPDYPMVSESYSERRRALAQEMGLGQKGRAARAKANETSQKGSGRRRTTD